MPQTTGGENNILEFLV